MLHSGALCRKPIRRLSILLLLLLPLVSGLLFLFTITGGSTTTTQIALHNFRSAQAQAHAPSSEKRRTISSAAAHFPSADRDSYQKYQFNITRSNKLPLDRAIPDTRPPGCAAIEHDLRRLAPVSIVIPFYNEDWSVLLRTIVSIINRTPANLIQEILMVDDSSDYAYLKGPLDRFLTEFNDDRISVIRKGTRDGLIIARMVGARKAVGDVLVFLDAHIEVNVGWLEPLLSALNNDDRLIALPNMDAISAEDMGYIKWLNDRQGGFTWTLTYEWKPVTEEALNENTSTKPFPTATTIGCAMALHRKYFFEIGAYDEGMLIWGGENLEISFRNWMCGGSMYVFPCSRVGHIFRKFLPYSFPVKFGSSGVIRKNLQRVAEVWMDDYRDYYYAAIQQRENFTATELQSLEKRKALRKRLSCKSFEWYLKHIIPELPVPKHRPSYFGQLKSATLQKCLYRIDSPNQTFSLGSCHAYDQKNTFALNRKHTLTLQTGECLIYDKTRTGLTHAACDVTKGKGAWLFVTETVTQFRSSYPQSRVEKGPLGQLVFRNRKGKACLATSQEVQYPYFMVCDWTNPDQFWYFTYQFKYEFAA